MTQYIYGNTRVRYTIAGIRIPACENTGKKEGWKPYTAVNSEQYQRLLGDPLFGELFDNGKIRVTTQKPEALEEAQNTFMVDVKKPSSRKAEGKKDDAQFSPPAEDAPF